MGIGFAFTGKLCPVYPTLYSLRSNWPSLFTVAFGTNIEAAQNQKGRQSTKLFGTKAIGQHRAEWQDTVGISTAGWRVHKIWECETKDKSKLGITLQDAISSIADY